ncbi:MAG: AAA family ATPase [Solobacterium sp.]|nr:AAA family ATPase [Solobacterium sp.]
MAEEKEIREALQFIDPAACTYQEWLNIGMAIKAAGYSCMLWDEWSRRDPKRYDGKCWKKWDTLNSSGITENTLFRMAIDGGYMPEGYFGKDDSPGREIHEGDIIDVSDYYKVIDKDMIDAKSVPVPENWNQIEDIRRYISVIFSPNDHVSYCTQCYQDKDGKYHPQNRNYDRTAGRLLEELDNAKQIEDVFYDYDHNCGAWISFNPMDGNGGKIDNITDFKYALIESDTQELSEQYALMTELELPIAALVHSGNKSIHAIVRVDASNEKDYSRKVDYLFKVCKKNGLDVDTSTKNPSRLSRMPGFYRGNNKQYLIATNIGKESWDEWVEYIESINDDLPDPETLAASWNNMPELSPELIHGILRQGHKMLMVGGTKAGKTYALIELAIAIAEGVPWMGWPCTRGKVLYVNLEVDNASCLHRFKDVYEAMEVQPKHLSDIDIWNLRGKAVPMDKLAPKLIRRAAKKGYIAVIVDPIYKVITGDENSAEDMSKFCNQFDKVATELHTAVIYCHHHSKGSQGQKRSMDRASGSGVFARDPDAMIDMIELPVDEGVEHYLEDKMICKYFKAAIRKLDPEYYSSIPYDDFMSSKQMGTHAYKVFRKKYSNGDDRVDQLRSDAVEKAQQVTAFRLDMTLREFPKPKPRNIYFDYPLHTVDETGVLADVKTEDEKPAWQKMKEKQKSPKEKKNDRLNELEIAYENLYEDENSEITVSMLAEEMGVSVRTVWRRIKESNGRFIGEKAEKDGISSPVKRCDINPRQP